MPAPKKIAKSAAFDSIRAAADARGETNDCGVIAAAVVSGAAYDDAHAALAKRGRKERRGSTIADIIGSVRELGCEVEKVDPKSIIDTYPGVHAGLKNITTHHPDRFAKQWPAGRYLLFVRGHVAAVVDGELIDWTRGSAKRVTNIFKIIPQSV